MGVDVNSHTRRLKTRHVKVKTHKRAYPHSPPIGELGALIIVPTLVVVGTLGLSWFLVKNTAKLAGKAVGTLAPNQTTRKEFQPVSNTEFAILLAICFIICPLILTGINYFNDGRLVAPEEQDVQEYVRTYQTFDEYMEAKQKQVDILLSQ